MSLVREALRGRPEQKSIIMENYYTALNYTETLEYENNHIIVKVHLHGKKKPVRIKAMVNWGATEDFINQEVCNKHRIKMIKATDPREIYLVDR